ncbi:MAG: hypothetical protein WAL30_06095 [Candidatus Aquirickettsiella sp.]
MVNDLNIFEEVSSSEETFISNERFIELLFKLEKDLQQLENETEEDLNDHFTELKKLKKMAILSIINIQRITWFLETAIFALMSELPEAFSVESSEIYKCMLERVRSFPKDAFREHLQVLLDKKNEENKELLLLINEEKEAKNQSFSNENEEHESEQRVSIIRSFFSILGTAKAKKRASSENDALSSKRVKRLSKISPLALPNNSVSNQVDDESDKNLLRPGMKLP